MTEYNLENVWSLMKIYDFNKDDLERNLFCILCKKLLINANFTTCGCRFCFDCIKEYLNEERKFCPGNKIECKTEIIDFNENISIDHSINNKISKLIVNCPNKSCEFKDELICIENHIRICNYRSIPCLYFNIGCYSSNLNVMNLSDHLQIEIHDHIKLLIDYIDNLKNEINMVKLDDKKKQVAITDLQIKCDRQVSDIDVLNKGMLELRNANKDTSDDVNVLKLDLDRKQKVIVGFQKEITEKNEEIEKLNKKLQQLESQCEEQVKQIEQVNNRLESSILKEKQGENKFDFMKSLDETMKSRPINLLNKLIYGEFEWIIYKINDKINDAKNEINTMIYSDSFYTHEHGYKMCLEIDPYGWKESQGTHLSIFFCLMKGNFDDMLEWPFKYPVTLTLINQRTKLPYLSKTMEYYDLPDNKNWIKPITEKNLGLGERQFIKLDELSNNNDLIFNNQIIIKCNINLNESIQFVQNKLFNLKLNQNKMNYGDYIWRINQFSDKMKDAKNGLNEMIYSDSFYTHKHGYKMCLRLDLNGDGNGRGTHLSVFYHLMKGEYDDILAWPFKFPVTFSLINQYSRLLHVSKTAKYDHSPNCNFSKPSNERNEFGYGFCKFLKLKELINNSDLVRHNQIFIKCSVNI